jgi:hypothetical protein
MKRMLLLLVVFIASIGNTQVKLWGIYNFEIMKGGKDSQLDKNLIPNGHLQLSMNQFQLFLNADITENISLMTRLGNNPVASSDFKSIEFQLAYVTFSNLIGDALSISAGKILTPFGSFNKRQLPTDNYFIGLPLFFSYPHNISPESGYLDKQTILWTLGLYGDRLNTVYTGGYYVGAEAYGFILDKLLEYDIALMNAPLSSAIGDYNVDDNISLHGRAVLHPVIWGSFGASFAKGSFVTPSYVNYYYSQLYGSLNRFTQSTYGVDATLSYLFYEINIEYLLNQYESPYIIKNANNWFVSGLSYGKWLDLNSNELLVDAKIEAPFYPGLYAAFRYNILNFSKIIDPDTSSATYGQLITWDRPVNRYAVCIGYKPDRAVLIKLEYEKTDVDINPKPDLNAARLAVVVSF